MQNTIDQPRIDRQHDVAHFTALITLLRTLPPKTLAGTRMKMKTLQLVFWIIVLFVTPLFAK